MVDGVELMKQLSQSPLGPDDDHHRYNIPGGKFALPPPVRGWVQLRALLRRQYLHKVSTFNSSPRPDQWLQSEPWPNSTPTFLSVGNHMSILLQVLLQRRMISLGSHLFNHNGHFGSVRSSFMLQYGHVCMYVETRMAADDDGDSKSIVADDTPGLGILPERGGAFSSGDIRKPIVATFVPPKTGASVQFQEPAAALPTLAPRPPGKLLHDDPSLVRKFFNSWALWIHSHSEKL